MADGFDLHLDQDRADRLRAAADASGMSMIEYALEVLDRAAGDYAEDNRRWGEYLRTGETVGLEEALADFDAELDHRLAEKATAKKSA